MNQHAYDDSLFDRSKTQKILLFQSVLWPLSLIVGRDNEHQESITEAVGNRKIMRIALYSFGIVSSNL